MSVFGKWHEYTKQLLLTKMLGDPDFFGNNALYLSLWISPVVDKFEKLNTTGEVIANSYTRAAINNVPETFTEVLGGDIRNSVEISFPVALESWGIVEYIAIFDAETEGNLLFYSRLVTPKEVLTGDRVYFPPSSIRIGFSN